MNRFIALLLAFSTTAQAGSPIIWGLDSRGQNLAPNGLVLSDLQAINYNGPVNKILNQSAVSTSGWITYDDGASATPVDCTGGTVTETWTTSTSSPLRGTSSFLLSKDAANRQGEGASYAFTLDSADTSKTLQIGLDFYINDADYSAGDLRVYIYDVTNTTLITPSSVNLTNAAHRFTTTFSSTTSTSYRLCIHTAGTGAGAWDAKFDDIFMGPRAFDVASTNSLYTTKSADYVILDNDNYLIINLTAGGTDRTITLPAAANNANRILIIVKADGLDTDGTGSLTIARAGGDTINGATSQKLFSTGDNIRLVSNGTDAWVILKMLQVEYLSNSAATGGNTSDDTTNFIYATGGQAVGAITATLERRVRALSARTAYDRIELQFDPDNTDEWQAASVAGADSNGHTNWETFTVGGAEIIGAGIYAVSGNLTDIDAKFGRYRVNTAAWSGLSNLQWRIVKTLIY